MIDSSVICDYRSGYPVPQAVTGIDWKKYARRRERYTAKIKELETECDAVETYIEEIKDSVVRRIFRMYFIEGHAQQKIAKQLHLAQATVSKKISELCGD